mgnify:CR=1 FL=1
MLRGIFFFIICCALSACAHTGGSKGAGFSGKVVHVAVEGGFYGIITDSGEKLDPVNLPPSFRQDGLRISGTYVEKTGIYSLRMWGKVVELVDIKMQHETRNS